MKLTIDRRYREHGPAPLYHQYDGQTTPQPAYLELTEDGEAWVDYSPEIGGAVPARVYDGRDQRWAIPNTLSVAGIDALLDELEPLLEQRHGATGEEARDLDEQIETAIAAYAETTEPPEHEQLVDATEWASTAWDTVVEEYDQADDKDAYVDELRQIAAADDVVLVNIGRLRGALDHAVESRMEEMSDLAEELGKSERTIQWHAKRVGVESIGGMITRAQADKIRRSVASATPGRPAKPPTEE